MPSNTERKTIMGKLDMLTAMPVFTVAVAAMEVMAFWLQLCQPLAIAGVECY